MSDNTSRFLALIQQQYQLVDYSFTPAGTGKLIVIAPSNPNRVAFYLYQPQAVTPAFGFRNPGGTFLPFPVKTANDYPFVNIHDHSILPTLEMVFNDTVIAQKIPCWGIVKI